MEKAILSALHEVSRLELTKVREMVTPEEKEEAEAFLKKLGEKIQTVEYSWVDELIDRIDLGLHKDKAT